MAIVFLSLAEVMAIHEDVVRRYGGAPGTRDATLLESAVGVPPATFGGRHLHDDMPAMAAAYCFHLVANHPFVDGNKRVGATAANVFLEMNGCTLDVDNESYATLVIDIAAGRSDKQAATEFYRRHVRPSGT